MYKAVQKKRRKKNPPHNTTGKHPIYKQMWNYELLTPAVLLAFSFLAAASPSTSTEWALSPFHWVGLIVFVCSHGTMLSSWAWVYTFPSPCTNCRSCRLANWKAKKAYLLISYFIFVSPKISKSIFVEGKDTFAYFWRQASREPRVLFNLILKQ